MADNELTDLDRRVIVAIEERFPVSQSPYCDLADELGALESDVLNSTMKLREWSQVAAIVAVFAPEVAPERYSAEDAALAAAVSFDLPWSEHPYAEVAAQLSLQGIDRDEAWVIGRLQAWLDDGTIVGVAARS